MQIAMSVIMVLVGIVIVAFAATKVASAAAREPTDEFERQHPVIATFLAAPGLLREPLGKGRNTATVGWLLGGVGLVATGIAYLFV